MSSSPTPAMLNAAFRRSGIDAVYTRVSVAPQELERVVASMRRTHRGFNVTIPFKKRVAELVDRLEGEASRVVAVNTVRNEGSELVGFNTDVYGISVPLTATKRKISSALLIGAGGVARAFCAAAGAIGCSRITVAVRDTTRGSKFASEMKSALPSLFISVVPLDRIPADSYDLIFNGTPMGSKKVPLAPSVPRAVPQGSIVFDAVYSPVETELLSIAARKGCLTIHGYEMLLHQAVGSFVFWTSVQPDTSEMMSVLLEQLRSAE